MQRSNRELWLALITILLITLLYLLVMKLLQGIPAASSLFGHGIGIVGFILMLMTETLYTLRKRSTNARLGRMANWLKFHIFTGLVGPYMVLLHTSWKFNGLAGIALLLTIIIVASGFIGRYIYTAVPRTIDGVELTASDLMLQIEATTSELNRQLAIQPASAIGLAQLIGIQAGTSSSAMGLVFGRFFSDIGFRWQAWRLKQRLPAAMHAQADQLIKLQMQRRTLSRQVASLAMARRMLGLWQTIHMPIGMALFTAAIIHVVAAIYYATLLR